MFRTHALRVVTAAVVGCAILIGAASASAAPWVPLSERSGSILDEVALTRDANGALNAVFREDENNVLRIRHRSLPASGGAWSASSLVVDNWIGIVNPDIEVINGVPHAFWGGQRSTDVADPASSGRAWYSTWVNGAWTAPVVLTNLQSPYASSQFSSAIAADGVTPWFTWSGTGLLATHAGLDQMGPEQNLNTACCEYASNLQRDAATGDIYLVWHQNITDNDGYFARRIAPALGDTIALPDVTPPNSSIGRTNRLPAAARTTGGVFSAYCDTYPSCTSIRLAGTDGKSLRIRTAIGGGNGGKTWTAAAPLGRMWVIWGDNANRTYAVRTNRAMTKWGPVQEVGKPAGTESTWNMGGDAAFGPLELVMNATATGGTRLWHTRVLPPLALKVVSVKKAKSGVRVVTFQVNDAGDPLKATVKFRGKSAKTNAAGVVKFTVPKAAKAGKYPASAVVTGYVAAKAIAKIS